MEDHPIYDTWAAMIQRCENPKNKFFASYGGRGISVCAEWHDFRNFFRDMGHKPGMGYSIGRIDNDIGYESGNCRWETQKQQIRNRSNTKRLTYNGETLPVGEWAERIGVPYKILKDRIAAKWSVSETLTLPYPSNRWARRA